MSHVTEGRDLSMLARWKPLVALAGLVVALGSSANALAAPGDFDATFDGDGARGIDSGAVEHANAVALQPDGKIVVAGFTSVSHDAAVYRLNPDGSLDASFDGDGARGIDSGGAEFANAVALQPDGKIVVAGSTSVNFDAAVYRLNPNGSFDDSFDGDGARAIDSGAAEFANAVALQPDGKIVVVGSTSGNFDAVVYRLNPDGSLDASFDGDGARGIDSGGEEYGNAVALQPDGKIVVVGFTSVNGNATVYRLNPNGSFDASFDGDGARAIDSGSTEYAKSVAVQPAGKLVVVGSTSVNDDAVVYRLNPNGSLDASFDGDGARGIDSGGEEHGNAVALQPDGKILVAGETSVNDDAAVYRLNPNGSLDASFDGDGARGIDSGGREVARAVALQPDRKVVLAGVTTVNDDAVVYRLQGDPPQGDPPAGGPGGRPPQLPRCDGKPATIVGTSARDVLRGTPRADVIVALGGNDVIRAGRGDDLVCGGAGRDRLDGGPGSDRLRGQAGGDRLLGRTGRDRLAGGAGNDRLLGGAGRDRLFGGLGRDLLRGGPGRDLRVQ